VRRKKRGMGECQLSSVEPFTASPLPLENVGEEFRECDFPAEIKRVEH